MASIFRSVASAERQIYSSCPNNSFVLLRCIDGHVGKSVSSCSYTVLPMVVTQLSHRAVAFKSLCSLQTRSSLLWRQE